MTARAYIGILGLQGDFKEHLAVIETLGHSGVLVRHPKDLESVDALIIPGGESTTIGLLMQKNGLVEPILEFAAKEHPIMGTCAGMIVLAKNINGGVPGQVAVGLLDLEVRRNAFGRQVDSFEADVLWKPLNRDIKGVFIRAPAISRIGENVVPVAIFDGEIVGVQQGKIIGISFHPELTDDTSVHQYFISLIN